MSKFEIFVIHYEPLVERRQYLESVLPNTDIPYTISTKYTRDNIDESCFCEDGTTIDKKNKITTTPVPPADFTLTPPIKANGLEHVHIYNTIVEKNLDFAIVLEDDAILVENFTDRLNNILNTLPEDWDVIYLSNGCQGRPILTKNGNSEFVISEKRQSWTASGYMLNKESARLFVDNIQPIVYPPDFELTYLQNLLKSNVYWLYDPIVYEGSNPISGKYYKYNSSVER